MSLILSFTGETKKTPVIIPAPPSAINSLSFRFYLFSHTKNINLHIITTSIFSLRIGLYNSLYIDFAESSLLLSPHIPENAWNTLTLEDTRIYINNLVCNIYSSLQVASLKILRLGEKKLKALIIMLPVNSAHISQDPGQYIPTSDIEPLTSLDELGRWQPICQHHQSRYSLQKTIRKTSSRQLIVCHDSGELNYKYDVSINTLPCAYRYLHWARTDMFIYFSHSRVTIPPSGWTENAHKNGSLSLGTFITEGTNGELDNRKLLLNGEFYANKLVQIMAFYKFDGYLLNFEADVNNASALAEWVQLLTSLSHSVQENSKIIWYDSITIDGKVAWQSQLNDLNKLFFDECDGFFTDYHWNLEKQKMSTKNSENRNWEVYTGTDFYGRGTYGGGQFHSRVGVENCPGTSVALFAPAWTWANPGHKEFNGFIQNENLVWGLRSTPIIDFGGKITDIREPTTMITALNQWEVYISNTDPKDQPQWKPAVPASKQWKVTDDLTFISSYTLTKRSVYCDLLSMGLKNIKLVKGTVQVKGQGPKYNDYYKILLRVNDLQGQSYEVYKEGTANEDWQTIDLEMPGVDIIGVQWEEIGKDAEYWQGYFGCCFKGTYVVCIEDGKCLLEEFEEKVYCEKISTWFNLGQGPKLYRRGKVVRDKVWDSIQDCDMWPDYLVAMENVYSHDKAYNGTTSLKLKPGVITVFKGDFEDKEAFVKVVYTGSVALLLENAELDKSYEDGEWKIDVYKHSGLVNDVNINSSGVSYLGGLHFYNDFPSFNIEIASSKVNWNIDSWDSGKIIFDYQVQMNELPEFIRYVDVFVDGTFVSRGYTIFFIVEEIECVGEEAKISFQAEDLKGDVASEVEIVVTKEQILSFLNTLY